MMKNKSENIFFSDDKKLRKKMLLNNINSKINNYHIYNEIKSSGDKIINEILDNDSKKFKNKRSNTLESNINIGKKLQENISIINNEIYDIGNQIQKKENEFSNILFQDNENIEYRLINSPLFKLILNLIINI